MRASRVGMRAIAATFVAGAGIVFASTLVPAETGCAGKAPPPAAPQEIVIGASLGLTGGLAGTASAQRDAIIAAQGQINAAGGLLGRPVRFEIEDDQGDEADIVKRVANDLVSKGVIAVIGPIGSSQVVAVQDIYRQAHVVEISASATSTKLDDIQPPLPGDRWLFRTTPNDAFQGAAVMLFAQRTPRGLGDAGAPMTDGGPIGTCANLAVVYIQNAYGTAMDQVIHDNWRNNNPQMKAPVIELGIPVDLASDYKAQVDQVYKASPQCLAFIMYEDTGAEFIKEFKADARFNSLPNGFFFIGTDGVDDDTFTKNARSNPSDPTSPNAADDVSGTTPDTQPGTSAYNEFNTIFQAYHPANFGKDAPPFASNAYDAAMVIALGIVKAGTVDDRVAVRDAIVAVAKGPGKNYTPRQYLEAVQALQQGANIDYNGAATDVNFDSKGNVKGGFSIWQVYTKPDKTRDFKTIGRFGLQELLGQIPP